MARTLLTPNWWTWGTTRQTAEIRHGTLHQITPTHRTVHISTRIHKQTVLLPTNCTKHLSYQLIKKTIWLQNPRWLMKPQIVRKGCRNVWSRSTPRPFCRLKRGSVMITFMRVHFLQIRSLIVSASLGQSQLSRSFNACFSILCCRHILLCVLESVYDSCWVMRPDAALN